MSIPTPAEVTAALEVLRRIPKLNDDTTIGHVEKANAPTYRLARGLRHYLEEDTHLDPDDIPSTRDLQHAIGRAIAEHGLRITTDPEPGDQPEPPGELFGFVHIERKPRGWVVSDDLIADNTEALPGAGANERHAAVYLLPEGGQA